MSQQQTPQAGDSRSAARRTLADHFRNLLGAAAIAGATLLLIEIALVVVDPWGMSYFDDLAAMGNEIFTADEARGYIMPDGEYQFSHWRVRIEDGARHTPAVNANAECSIAVLGDSVAFGYGVADEDVWLNHVAAELDDVRFDNYALPRYNSSNSLWTLRAYPDYDAYLFLLIGNDLESAISPETHYFAGQGEGMPWMVRYANFAIFRGIGTSRIGVADAERVILPDTPALQRLTSELDAMFGHGRIVVAAFDDEALTHTLLERGYDLALLRYPPYRISFADYHLNEQGNLELAEQLHNVLDHLADQYCPQRQ